MESLRVYKVLFWSHFHFTQSLKVKRQGSAMLHTWPLRISCGQWDGLLPQGCLTGPEVAQRLPLGSLKRTDAMKQHKRADRPAVGDQEPRTSMPSGAARGAGRAQIGRLPTASNRDKP